MEKHEITVTDDSSALGSYFRPRYTQLPGGLGDLALLVTARFPEGVGFVIEVLADSYTLRLLDGGDLTSLQARAAIEYAAQNLSKITGEESNASGRYVWTIADGVGTDVEAGPASPYTLREMLNALADGDFTDALTTAAQTNTTLDTDDWVFLDPDNGEIFFGPASATFEGIITTASAAPHLTATLKPSAWE